MVGPASEKKNADVDELSDFATKKTEGFAADINSGVVSDFLTVDDEDANCITFLPFKSYERTAGRMAAVDCVACRAFPDKSDHWLTTPDAVMIDALLDASSHSEILPLNRSGVHNVLIPE